MTTITDEIRSLKTQAKNRRDLRRYDRAVQILDRAIELAKENLENPELVYRMAEELADCYALLGGVQRRWALQAQSAEERVLHLAASIRAYDAAWKFESNDKYRVVNSYGMVNRLVSRLILKPESLKSEGKTNFGENGQSFDIRVALEEAKHDIEEQLALPRRDDYWAAADLALVKLLLEEEEPAAAYARFLAKTPPDYAFRSVLEVLRPLSELKWPLAEKFKQASTYLEEHAPL